jgi:hypothetical protein
MIVAESQRYSLKTRHFPKAPGDPLAQLIRPEVGS